MSLIYPTMVTPFKDDGTVDYVSLEKFIEFLLNEGADGLFAVCQSSEMFDLSIEEKIKIAEFISKRCSREVVASGHTQKGHYDQVEAMKMMAATGIDSVILISNAFAEEGESSDVFIKNIDNFLCDFKEDIPLGIYECPYPYKRLLSERELKFIVDTGRFSFLKDTSCEPTVMRKRLDTIGESGLRLFNAHVETVSETSGMGGAGFSGVLGNLAIKAVRFVMDDTDAAKKLSVQDAINRISEYMRSSHYPVCAKALLKDMGIFRSIHTRVKNHDEFSDKMLLEGIKLLDAIRKLESEYADA